MKVSWTSVVALAAVLMLAWPARGDSNTAAESAPAQIDFVPAPHVTSQEVDAAIARGVASLYGSQIKETGRWSDYPNNLGGLDVCALTALAYAHETNKPEFQKGLAALRELDPDTTYVLGFRLILYAELYRQAEHKHEAVKKEGLRKAMGRDAKMLADFQLVNGAWDYRKAAKGATAAWDFSNTQLAVLGLQQAALCGVEIPTEVWVKVQELYLDKQRPDGGWNYGRPPYDDHASYGSMTAAAVASLLITRDMLAPGLGCPCRDGRSSGHRNPQVDLAIARGAKWLGDNFETRDNPLAIVPFSSVGIYYWLYAVERVAIATGFKYLGPHNWYAEGAHAIIGQMQGSGAVSNGIGGAVPNTAFALLFLIKGRGPILMNKLQHGSQWDLHPHDLANLTHYVGDVKEQQINWQVINLQVPVQEMHDAPILYLSAENAFKPTAEEKKKLRDFTDTGGTILFEASCGNKGVDAAWRKTCLEIWPEWELGKLDKTHPLWTADVKIMTPPPLWGASDGTRTFLLYASTDLSCAWNTNNIDKSKGLFDLGSNLWAYTTDRGKLRGKLETHEIGTDPRYAATTPVKGSLDTITVARLRHGGDWNVARNYHQWETLSTATNSLCGLTITEADPVVPGAAVPSATTMLYLTGRTSCDLDAAGRTWLKNYLSGGGFLFAESALGDKRFDKSLRDMVAAAGLTFKKMDALSPLISGALPGDARGYLIKGVGYTFALRDERMGMPMPELLGIYLGEKMVGVYSPFDVMFRQTGCAAFDCRGYEADDARAVAVNLVLYASTLSASGPAASSASPATPAEQ